MIKTILVHLSGTGSDKSVLATALNVARPFDAHLQCLHIIPDYKSMVYQWVEPDPGNGMVVAEALNALESEAKARSQRARKSFEEFCAAKDIASASEPPGPPMVSATLREETGAPMEVLIAQTRYHDLVLVAGGTTEGEEGFSKEELGNLIVSAGRPIMLGPKSSPKAHLRTVAIAWKNSAESARAITAAMPFLAKAHHILVLSANEDDAKAAECLDCYESVANQLRWHGLKAEGRYIVPGGRTIPNAVLDTAHEIGADLLVMGGYSHSRMRELVFGGFTRRILEGADLPVLVFH